MKYNAWELVIVIFAVTICMILLTNVIGIFLLKIPTNPVNAPIIVNTIPFHSSNDPAVSRNHAYIYAGTPIIVRIKKANLYSAIVITSLIISSRMPTKPR